MYKFCLIYIDMCFIVLCQIFMVACVCSSRICLPEPAFHNLPARSSFPSRRCFPARSLNATAAALLMPTLPTPLYIHPAWIPCSSSPDCDSLYASSFVLLIILRFECSSPFTFCFFLFCSIGGMTKERNLKTASGHRCLFSPGGSGWITGW